MSSLLPAIEALFLVALASSVPWAVGRLCGACCAWPLDFGYTLRDGQRLLGDHKTWRGLVAGIAACSIAGGLIGSGLLLGAAVGGLALAGDALSSVVKRRFRRAPGAEVPGLDQLPEALLPLLVLQRPLQISMAGVMSVALLFTALDLALTPLRHSPRHGREPGRS